MKNLPKTWKRMQQWSKAYRERKAIEAIIAGIMRGFDEKDWKEGEVGAAVGGTGQMVALDFEDVVKGGTTATDKSHNNLPPFYGVYFVRRTSRLYYSI